MTQPRAKSIVRAKWGKDGRIRKTWEPFNRSGRWVYEVGLQEYYSGTVSTPLGPIPNPRTGQPFTTGITPKGKGASWELACKDAGLIP